MTEPDYAFLWVKFWPRGQDQTWNIHTSESGPSLNRDFLPEWPWYKIRIPVPREFVAGTIDVSEDMEKDESGQDGSAPHRYTLPK